MRRRHARPGRQRQRIAPSAEAQAVLVGDYPARAKAAMRLLAKGGRQRKQICFVCGKRRGVYQEVWLPAQLLQPLPDEDAVAESYWTCAACHASPPPNETLVELLARRRR